jgi:hypothetical protein
LSGDVVVIDLGDGKLVAVHAHSGKVWLTSYNGCGTVNFLDAETAKRLSKALWYAAGRLQSDSSSGVTE